PTSQCGVWFAGTPERNTTRCTIPPTPATAPSGRERSPGHARPDGRDHVPRQAARDRLPVFGDLRGSPVFVGLRAPGCRAEAERPGGVVAVDRPGARRRGWARR